MTAAHREIETVLETAVIVEADDAEDQATVEAKLDRIEELLAKIAQER